MRIRDVALYQVRLPLARPYRVSFRTYTDVEPLLVRVRDEDGGAGWGEAYIPPGSTVETIDSGWRFCDEHAQRLPGAAVEAAAARIGAAAGGAPFAACALLTALAMLARHEALVVREAHRVPLLLAVSGRSAHEIAEEVERDLDEGYRTLKVKVGWNVDDDLARVRSVQRAVAGRAEITIDANRGYDREQGMRFAQSLEPRGIALFEQPCGADAWEDNAAVARVSRVPLMLDESIRTVADVERAAAMPGVGLVKMKLKRMGGIERALAAMRRARALGLDICFGDGVATELLCWVEACVGRGLLRRAGDMNGCLKPRARLFREPLPFERGAIALRPGFWPQIDEPVVAAHAVREACYARAAMAAS
jgi:L-alanine-DL-glutamate epimerase-like enolase superfamily enzyme